VECVSWQVIVAGPRPVLDLTQQGAATEGALHRGTRRAWFGGAYVETPVLDRLALRPGESVQGPALIEERECTLVLPPGATALCDAALNLDVTLPV
jgi:N-methylhydantoinase A/oxoprolinase/acetone carboxylase beta subunit